MGTKKIYWLVGTEVSEYRVYPKPKVNERGKIAPTSSSTLTLLGLMNEPWDAPARSIQLCYCYGN